MKHLKTSIELEELLQLLPRQRILIGTEIEEEYSHDEMSDIKGYPDFVLIIETTEEVSEIMKYASRYKIPVTVRGAGTGLVGSAVALSGGIMLDMTRMNKILELDEETLSISVEPGVLLMDLIEYVEGNGFFYPPDPGEKSATIGGNISTNAGGMRAIKYGVTRDYVLGLTVVLPDGTILELGGKTVKNSSGYSLRDLVCGSEGTLCIITQAILKLLPMPKKTISYLAAFPTLNDAITTVLPVIRSGLNPTAIEFMEQSVLLYAEQFLGKKFPDRNSKAYLLLTLDGCSMEYIEEQEKRLTELCLSEGAVDVFRVDTLERKDSVWKARGAFLEAIKASTIEIDECDVVVPINRIADFLKVVQKTAEEFDIRIPSFGHAGDGNLHVYLCRDEMGIEEWKEKKEEVFNVFYRKAYEMGGMVSGEHGIGYAKKQYFIQSQLTEYVDLLKRIKNAFDPLNILNPGKIF